LLLRDFQRFKAVNDNIIYRYNYDTDFVNVGIKLLNIKTKETNNSHREDIVKHIRLVFRKVCLPEV